MITILSLEIPIVWIHLAILSYTVIVILIADRQGFSWMRGDISVLDKKKIKRLLR